MSDRPASDTLQTSGGAVYLTALAGILMFLLGGWWIIAGFVAIVNDDFFVVTQEWIFQFSTTSFPGAGWARTVGVILAVISGLVAFAWLPYYPVWAILFVTMSVLTVWALTVHGRDITMGYEEI